MTTVTQRYATELHRIETAGRYTADAYGNWLPQIKAEYLRLLQLWNRDNYRQWQQSMESGK